MKSRIFVAVSLILLAVSLYAGEPAKKSDRYSLTYSISTSPNGHQIRYSIQVKDATTGEIVTSPTLSSQPGISAEIKTKKSDAPDDNRLFLIKITPDKGDGGGTIVLEVKEDNALIQTSTYRWDKAAAQPAVAPGNDPITLNLKDADISDVLKTFGQLTNHEVVVDPAVSGRVSINVTNVPWHDALQQVVSQVGAKATIDGKTIHVTK